MKKYVVIFLMFIILTGCNNEYENELNILNWSSYIPDDVISDFEKEYNINVNYSTYSSNEELLAKVTSTKLGTYDLVFPSDYMVKIMKDKNLLEPIDKSKLYNVNNINNDYLNKEYDYGNYYSLPFLAATVVIAYDNSKIDDNIYGYNDLLNDKYKNEIVLIEDERMIVGMALLANGYSINETSDQAYDEALNWLLKLKKNVKIFDSDSPKSFLISGETSIGVIWNAEAVLANYENSNIEFVYPREGVMMSIDNYVILKDAKNVDNAYLFIDYLLRSDVMGRVLDNYPYVSVNKYSNFYGSGKYNFDMINVDSSIVKNAQLVQNIGSNISKIDKIWVKIK